MRDTPDFSANTWKGRRTLRLMRCGGMFKLCVRNCRRWRGGSRHRAFRRGCYRHLGCLRLRLGLRFVNCSDHVECALRIVFEFIAEDALTTVQRVLETDELSLETGELFGGEKGLRKKSLQPARAIYDATVLRRKLLQAEHGNNVLELRILRQCSPDFLRQPIVPLADNTCRRHGGVGLQRINSREESFAGSFA